MGEGRLDFTALLSHIPEPDSSKNPKEPLTPRQQRAWMRGFVQAQLATVTAPGDAPAEIRDNFPALVAWMTKVVAPHRLD